MKIVIAHLTRMAPGYICVAGIDLETQQHVRIIPKMLFVKDGRLSSDFLKVNGGIFEIGAIIEIDKYVPLGNPPEVEDIGCNPNHIRCLELRSKADMWDLVSTLAKSKLTDIFGEALVRSGKVSYVVEQGQGIASLGLFKLKPPAKMSVSKGLNESKVRLLFKYEDKWINLSVTDVRLFTDDGAHANESMVERACEKLKKLLYRDGVILGVGLTRPFASFPGEKAVHWLQVTNLYFKYSNHHRAKLEIGKGRQSSAGI